MQSRKRLFTDLAYATRMHGATALLWAGLLAVVGLDLARTLKTGRARGRSGTITLRGQPARYWRYVYSSAGFLAVGAIGLIWAVVT